MTFEIFLDYNSGILFFQIWQPFEFIVTEAQDCDHFALVDVEAAPDEDFAVFCFRPKSARNFGTFCTTVKQCSMLPSAGKIDLCFSLVEILLFLSRV